MHPDIKARWVDALRSGRYEQGRNRLRTGDRYCCLGVLCDLAVKDGVGEWTGGGNFTHNGNPLNTSWSSLTNGVADWAGIDAIDPGVWVERDGRRERLALASLNDEGVPFDKIADFIERDL